jgi:inhibitor of cysteine peptidase
MFTKFILTILTTILLVSLAGCGTTNQSTPNSSQGTNNSQNPSSENITDTSAADNYEMLPIISGKVANLKLDASADGTTQQLKKGEVMSVTLESNPSTGYAWLATISNTATLVQMAEPDYSEPGPSATPLVGAPGTQTFFFQAIETGNATLTLDYKRNWETGVAPIQTITIVVNVQ